MRNIHSFVRWQGFLFVCLGIIAFPTEVLASTGSSSSAGGSSAWAKPAWMSDDSSSHTTRAKRSDVPTTEVSPYGPGSHNIALDLGQVFCFLSRGPGKRLADVLQQ